MLTRRGSDPRQPADPDVPVPDHRQPGAVRGHRPSADGRPGGRRRAVRLSGREAERGAHDRRLQWLGVRTGLARVLLPGPGAVRGADVHASSSTSARGRSAPCTAISTRRTSTRSGCPTCTPTTAWTCPGSIVAATYSPTAPWPAIPVYGPAGTARPDRGRVRGPGAAPEPAPGIAERFDYADLAAAATDRAVRGHDTIAAAHPVEAYAIRVTDAGRCSPWSSPATPAPTRLWSRSAQGADLLLSEAAFLDAPDNPPGLHLTGRDAAQLATPAGVGRLVLTHIPPWHEPARVLAEARPHFAGPIQLAVSGLQIEI